MARKSKNGMRIFLGVVLAIALFGLYNLGVNAFYPGPDYDDYCTPRPAPVIENKSDYYEQGDNCWEDYDINRDAYNRQIFYVLLIGGLVLAIAGLFLTPLLFQIAGVGAGSALLIEAIIRNLDDRIMAFIAGAIVFVILGYFSWKKFGGDD